MRSSRSRSNPIPWQAPLEVDRFCHAKVWMTDYKLAIGSLELHGSGIQCSRTRSRGRHAYEHRGGLHPLILRNWTQSSPKTHLHSALQFATVEEMERESLVVPPDIPLDVLVSFDWGTRRYCVVNQTSHVSDTYTIRLPDVKPPIALPAFNAPKVIAVEAANEISFNHFSTSSIQRAPRFIRASSTSSIPSLRRNLRHPR